MVALPLPAGVDGATLQKQLYEDYQIEIPHTKWRERSFLRLSLQGYNTQDDVDVLMSALKFFLR